MREIGEDRETVAGKIACIHRVGILSAVLLVLLFCCLGCEKAYDTAQAKSAENAVPENLSAEEMASRYAKAVALFEEKGEQSRAEVRELMTPLAPSAEGEMGIAGAHQWIANDLLRTVNRLPGKLRRQTMKEAQRHLEKVIALEPKNLDAHLALGQFYARQRNPEKALAFLEEASEHLPGVKVLLAYTYESQGNAELSKKFAAEGADYWEKIATAELDNSIARLRWARAETLLGNTDEVLAILEEGRKHSNAEPYDQFEFSIRLKEARDALSESPPQPDKAVEIVEEFLARSPANSQAILKLSDIATQFPEVRSKVTAKLEEISNKENPPWSALYALATIAMEEGDYEKALPFCEKNYELAPKSPFVIINLAWCLSKISPLQMNRALEVIERLPPGFESNPIAQRTRGRILVRLGRHEEGLADLQKALPSIEKEEQIEAHGLMAEAQEALGNFEMAKEHRIRTAADTDPVKLATVPLSAEKQKKKKKKKKKKGDLQYEPGVRKVMLPTRVPPLTKPVKKNPDSSEETGLGR